MDLGERIKHARTGAGLNQTELAKAAGVTKGSVSQWENGNTKNLRMENLFAVADATKFSAKWIALGKGPERMETMKPYSSDELMEAVQNLSDEALAVILRTAADKLRR